MKGISLHKFAGWMAVLSFLVLFVVLAAYATLSQTSADKQCELFGRVLVGDAYCISGGYVEDLRTGQKVPLTIRQGQ